VNTRSKNRARRAIAQVARGTGGSACVMNHAGLIREPA
jgi:hypothetical protein